LHDRGVPDGGQDGTVGRQPRHVVELSGGQPAQLVVVLERAWLALDERGNVHVQGEAGSDVGRAEQLTDGDPDTQLLAALAGQGAGRGLAGLDLAAGELPAAGERGRCAAPGGQHPAVVHDRGPDDDLHGRTLSLRCRAWI